MGKDWADDVDDEDDVTTSDDLRARFGGSVAVPQAPAAAAPAPADDSAEPTSTAESPAVASLLSRISGLSTDQSSEPSQPSTTTQSPQRPRPNAASPLFGKALAGIKADRTLPPASTATENPATSATAPPADPAAPSAAVTASVSSHKEDAVTNPSTPIASAPSSEKKDDMPIPVRDDGWGDGATTVDTGSVKMDDAASGLISNEFQVEVKLADLQADPNSPLYSVKSFEELPIHDDLRKGIYAVGFTKPSKIQEKALPLLLINPPRNLIGQSQSGTGKTAAFTLNMLSRVDPALMTPQAICLAPSRELARQIQEVVDKLGQFTQIKTHLAVPGSWVRSQRIDKHILIGTPGTLSDMLSRGGRIFDPKMIRVFVLDEADEMIQLQGLGDQTFRIKKFLPPGVQNVLFSATFPDEVQEFADMFAPEANKIFLRKEDVTVDAIKQLYLECSNEQGKFDALSALYDCMSIGQSIVFCRRKATADEIAKRLIAEGHSVASLHGDKMTSERDDILDGFRNGKTKVLITTNVIARGIDIQQVNMVVNYDVPDMGPEGGYRPDIETYIHRIGRTGRFGRKGCSVTFVHDERSRRDVDEIMRTLGKPMKKIDAKSQTDLEQLEKALKIALKGPN